MTLVEEKANYDEAKKLLVKGHMFNKIKHSKPQKREIWLAEDVTAIFWGEDNKKKINGSLNVQDILSIAPGMCAVLCSVG
jgi:hypothetical protein